MARTSPPQNHSKEAFIFIDGNNLFNRFENILKEKLKIESGISEEDFIDSNGIIWKEGNFLWKENMSIDFPQLSKVDYEIIRAYYYTYCNESESKETSKEINETSIISGHSLTLTPEIIVRSKKEKAKGDDIKICIDSMKHALNNSADIIYLFSGDGDFLPLIKEIQSMGKYVFVAAFDYLGENKELKKATGLNYKIKERADYFLNLSPIFGLTGQGG